MLRADQLWPAGAYTVARPRTFRYDVTDELIARRVTDNVQRLARTRRIDDDRIEVLRIGRDRGEIERLPRSPGQETSGRPGFPRFAERNDCRRPSTSSAQIGF